MMVDGHLLHLLKVGDLHLHYLLMKEIRLPHMVSMDLVVGVVDLKVV
jgi:hypothetical protein